MTATKDTFVEYLKRTKAPAFLHGVAADHAATLASDGETVLWHTDPLYTSLAPQLDAPMQRHMMDTLKAAIAGETLASIVISRHNLQLLGDMLGKRNNTEYATIHINTMGANTVLLVGTKDDGMAIMPMLPKYRNNEQRSDAPFLFWGLDEDDE